MIPVDLGHVLCLAHVDPQAASVVRVTGALNDGADVAGPSHNQRVGPSRAGAVGADVQRMQLVHTGYYGVAISPLAVATIHRLPQRTMESILPTPGTVSPRAPVHRPSGPSSTAV